MARALYNVRILFSVFSDDIILSSRRLSSSAAAYSEKMTLEEKVVLVTGMKKSGSTISDAAAAPAPMHWVPDPVTGYYRPANRIQEIDPAEQRQMLLNNKE